MNIVKNEVLFILKLKNTSSPSTDHLMFKGIIALFITLESYVTTKKYPKNYTKGIQRKGNRNNLHKMILL